MVAKPRKRGPVKFVHRKAVKLFKDTKPVFNGISHFVISTMAKMIAEGVPYYIAAQAAGVTVGRVQKWREKGELIADHIEKHLDYPEGTTDEDKMCYEFQQLLDKQTARSSVHAIRKVRAGMLHDWRAAAWWLDRKVDGFAKANPGQFGSTPGAGSPSEAQQVIYVPHNGRGPSVRSDTPDA